MLYPECMLDKEKLYSWPTQVCRVSKQEVCPIILKIRKARYVRVFLAYETWAVNLEQEEGYEEYDVKS